MGQKNRRWIAAALTVLTAFSAVFSLPQGVAAAEPEHTNSVEQTASTAADEGGGPVLLEGISMDRTVLLMETGGKASLTASLIPEDTTEELEILWESDDQKWYRCRGKAFPPQLQLRREKGERLSLQYRRAASPPSAGFW